MQLDKLYHFLIGFAVGAFIGAQQPGFGLGALAGTLLGWGKEKFDKLHPDKHTYDGWDAYATALGATIGEVTASVVLRFVKL